ncbi:MAG: DUF3226 domain-containing protein [Rhodoferax sp.]
MDLSRLDSPALHVEGVSDMHTVIHLLGRHGVVLNAQTGPVVVKPTKGDAGLLNSMRTAAMASAGKPVGFVIDGDLPVAQRWQSVKDHLNGFWS